MKKIPTLFIRSESGKLVTPEINPDCQWVADGEGVATVKYDGTCCMVRDGKLYARYQAKTAPTPEYAALIGFIPSNEDGAEGHRHGWRLVDYSPADQYHREAWKNGGMLLLSGTYELVGPKVQSNPYGLGIHELWPHGKITVDAPRTFDELKVWLAGRASEGIVWWREINNPDCDKAKIKRRDFGLKWPM